MLVNDLMCALQLSIFAFCHIIAITCPPLEDIENGTIIYLNSTTNESAKDYAYNSTAMFECFIGHILTGVNTSTCTGNGSSSNGVWSDNVPQCSRKLIVIIL